MLKTNRAFTLVELLVSLALLAGLGFFIASFFHVSTQKNVEENQRNNVEGEMREFFGKITKTLRAASSLTLAGTSISQANNIQTFPQIMITQLTRNGDVMMTLDRKSVV